MKCLWILKLGIHCLIVLLLLVFFLTVRGADLSVSTALPLNGSALKITKMFTSPVIPSAKTPASRISSSHGTGAAPTLVVPGATTTTGTSLGEGSKFTAIPPVLLLTTNGTRPTTSSYVSKAPVSTTVTTSIGTNISIPETTAHEPERKPLKFWAILLICLTVASIFVGASIGCCFLWKKNIF